MPTMLGVVADSYNAPASGGPILTGLVRWYDATDASTITHTGGAVSAWRDKGPLGKHLAKGGSTVTTGTRTIGGVNALDFAAGFCTINGAPVINQPLTIIAVVQSDTTTPSNNQIFNGGSAVYASGGGWSIWTGGGLSTGIAINTSPHVVVFEVNGSSSAIYEDGIIKASGAGPGSASWSVTQVVGSDGGSSHWDGLIGEVLVYNRILTTPERQQVEAYLTNKWIPPFNPTSITGNQLWLDATDPATITYSSGTKVSNWQDKSGTNHHAYMAEVAKQGERNVTLNGQVAINFLNTCVYIPGFAASNTAAEIFIVLQIAAQDGLSGGLTGNWSNGSQTHYTYSGDIYEAWGRGDRPGLGNPAPSLEIPHCYNLRTAPGNYNAEISGVHLVNFATNTVVFTSGPYEIPNYGWGINGYIGEIIMYDHVLTSGERASIESYLGTKWGITFS